MSNNPIIWADYPDVDVIRVGDTYYMASTTMHFMPGCVVLRSYDLVHWETVTHVYDTLDSTPGQRLVEGHIYGKGMWAPTLRYHDGVFHIVFIAVDTHKTYHYTAERIEGPWKKSTIEGFFYDSSLLFDEDRVYIVHGNRQIYLTELESDLSGPKPGGLHRMIVEDKNMSGLGFEGSHLYKIGGKYVICMIHWPKTGTGRRTEAVYCADSLEGEWTGGDVLDDDLGFHNMGVAQGGLVDTPTGEWYAMLFQDHGAVGRIPVLVPVTWEDGRPRFAPVPHQIETVSTRPEHVYRPLVGSDDFRGSLDEKWEWNHEPELSLVSVGEGRLRLTAGRCVGDVEQAVNMLTQRTIGPRCAASVEVDGSALREGDYAGFCALQGCYGQLALMRREGKLWLSLITKREDGDLGERACIPWTGERATLRMSFEFEDMRDEVRFFYERDGEWAQIGEAHHLVYRLDHFTGCRIGLFLYATQQAGGSAEFTRFVYEMDA